MNGPGMSILASGIIAPFSYVLSYLLPEIDSWGLITSFR
jgi:hypothetical protein